MSAKSRLLPLILLGYLFLSPRVEATIIVPVPDRELIDQAVAIVVARVASITSHWSPQEDQIYTAIKLSLDEVLKGDLPEDELTIKQAGGTVGNLHSWVVGSAEFRRGEKVLLFLRLNPDGTFRVAHLFQGKCSIFVDDFTGEELAHREVPGGVHVVGSFDSVQGALPRPYDFHDFEDLKLQLRLLIDDDEQESPAPEEASVMAPERSSAELTEAHDQFTFLGSPSRWFEPDSDLPVTMFMNSQGEPAAPGRGFDQIRAAYDAWSRVEDSSLSYQDGGLTDAVGIRFDGWNAISFRDPLDQMDPPSNCSGTLAIGGYYRSGSETRVVNGRSFFRIVEGDIVFNDGWEGCGFYESWDNFAEVATHELGHVHGQGHSGNPDATMSAFAHFDGRGASLHADDIAGLVFMYPAAPSLTAPLIIGASRALQEGTVGSPYSASLGLSGGTAPYDTSLVKGSLPRGLSLSPEGVISGVPRKSGGRTFTVQVTDQDGFSASKALKIRIFNPLSIRTKRLKKGQTGQKYEAIFRARGGKKPFTWSIVSGSLPGGLRLDSGRGKITGTARASGTFSVTFRVADALGGVDERSLKLTVE